MSRNLKKNKISLAGGLLHGGPKTDDVGKNGGETGEVGFFRNRGYTTTLENGRRDKKGGGKGARELEKAKRSGPDGKGDVIKRNTKQV